MTTFKKELPKKNTSESRGSNTDFGCVFVCVVNVRLVSHMYWLLSVVEQQTQ